MGTLKIIDLQKTKVTSDSVDCVKMWSLNSEGLTADKIGELSHLMAAGKPHVVSIQETWLKPQKPDSEISIPGYIIFRKDRTDAEHGGVLTYCRHDLCATLLESNFESEGFEVIWLRIKSHNKIWFIANVYRPPSSDDRIFDALSADIEKFQMGSTSSKVMLFGDFNCHHSTWLNSANMHGAPKTNSAGLSCFAMCQTLGLENLVMGNTFL